MQGINGILHKKKIKILHFIFVSLSSSNCTIISSPTYLLINYFRITLPPLPPRIKNGLLPSTNKRSLSYQLAVSYKACPPHVERVQKVKLVKKSPLIPVLLYG